MTANGRLRWTTVLLAALCWLPVSQLVAQGTKIAYPTSDEPYADKFSPQRAGQYLDLAAVQWIQQRKCGSCHTTYAFLMARPSLAGIEGTAEQQIRKFFEDRAANWDRNKPLWDTEVVATAATLAMHDARTTGKLHPLTRAALDRMWTLQRKDGAWDWLKCGWPPMEHDDYYGALLAALGVGMAPDHYAASPEAKEGVARLRKYFATHPAPDLHHRAVLLWASQHLDGLMAKAVQKKTIEELLALQRPDGGWNLPALGNYKRHGAARRDRNDKNGPSDGYGTGLVVYVLRQAGVPASDDGLQRAVAWLKANQRVSGRWYTRSLSTDTYHFITYAGSAYAVMALEACGTPRRP